MKNLFSIAVLMVGFFAVSQEASARSACNHECHQWMCDTGQNTAADFAYCVTYCWYHGNTPGRIKGKGYDDVVKELSDQAGRQYSCAPVSNAGESPVFSCIDNADIPELGECSAPVNPQLGGGTVAPSSSVAPSIPLAK